MEFVVVGTKKYPRADQKEPRRIYVGEDNYYMYSVEILEERTDLSHSGYWCQCNTVTVRTKPLYSNKGRIYYRGKLTRRYLNGDELQDLSRFLNKNNYQISIARRNDYV